MRLRVHNLFCTTTTSRTQGHRLRCRFLSRGAWSLPPTIFLEILRMSQLRLGRKACLPASRLNAESHGKQANTTGRAEKCIQEGGTGGGRTEISWLGLVTLWVRATQAYWSAVLTAWAKMAASRVSLWEAEGGGGGGGEAAPPRHQEPAAVELRGFGGERGSGVGEEAGGHLIPLWTLSRRQEELGLEPLQPPAKVNHHGHRTRALLYPLATLRGLGPPRAGRRKGGRGPQPPAVQEIRLPSPQAAGQEQSDPATPTLPAPLRFWVTVTQSPAMFSPTPLFASFSGFLPTTVPALHSAHPYPAQPLFLWVCSPLGSALRIPFHPASLNALPARCLELLFPWVSDPPSCQVLHRFLTLFA